MPITCKQIHSKPYTHGLYAYTHTCAHTHTHEHFDFLRIHLYMFLVYVEPCFVDLPLHIFRLSILRMHVPMCVCVCVCGLGFNEVTRCWAHEIQRVFGDRLTAGCLNSHAIPNSLGVEVSYVVPKGQSLVLIGLGICSSDWVGFGLGGCFAARIQI